MVWGVLPQFIDGLQRAYPNVTWVDYRTLPIDYDCKEEKDMNGYRIVPLRWADDILGMSYDECMKAKYKLFNMDFSRWRENAMWVRDEQKEQELFDLVNYFPLNYKFVNNNYQSDGSGQSSIPTTIDSIEMKIIPGYSIFDWAKVLENAKEIHTVSTSLLYIIEMLDLTCPIHLYPRPNDPKFKHVDFLFTKPYILH